MKGVWKKLLPPQDEQDEQNEQNEPIDDIIDEIVVLGNNLEFELTPNDVKGGLISEVYVSLVPFYF